MSLWSQFRYRQFSGDLHHNTRISDIACRQIIERRRNGESAAKLAEEFGISQTYVYQLCKGRGRKVV